MDAPDTIRLEPPVPPFHPSASAAGSLRSVTPPTSLRDVSLTVNYLPTKFSRPHSPGVHKRKGKGGGGDPEVPKRGGGREAFKRGEARMPGVGDEDYDGVMPREGGKTKPRLRWNKFKWMLFLTNSLLSAYSIVGLVFCLLTWFNVWTNADVIRVGNRPELILSTLAAGMGIVTSLIGWSGVLLNNRAFLAVYTFLLWITFALLVVPGYVTYRHRAFNLEGKINSQWSRDLGITGRLRIQNALTCCGYFSPFSEATVSQTCYARATLPGCKGPYLKFERVSLERWYIIVFGLVPFHIGIMVTALLCSNHVTYRFGKGMMPKAYRLSLNSMAVIMDNYANQLAEQYGSDVASEVLARSRAGFPVGFAGTSQTNLDTMPVRNLWRPFALCID
ncbi:hypothetical protein K439DRAFT_1353233 [Ramaria rubella]|nr:hypothetical protein K439DRAFT_1353233 [Ramaria rubella]